jgi:hypothetical protein
VCLLSESDVTFCENCGINPVRRRFCSDACRQAAYRKRPAHLACLARKCAARLVRKAVRTEALLRDRYIGFDGREQGNARTDVPKLTGWKPDTGVQTDAELDRLWDESQKKKVGMVAA